MGWPRLIVIAAVLGAVVIGVLFPLAVSLLLFQTAAERERIELSHLPLREIAQPPPATAVLTLALQLTRAGTVLVSGAEVRFEDVEPLLAREARYCEALGQPPGAAKVLIAAERDVPAGKVQDLIRRCQANRFEQFVLRAAGAREKAGSKSD